IIMFRHLYLCFINRDRNLPCWFMCFTYFVNSHILLAVLVRFPFAVRPWARPVLVALYRSPEDDRRRGQPHKTPAELMQVLLRLLRRWFPEWQFVFAGDGGYGSHGLAFFAQRQRGRLTLVSRFHPKANLFEPPPAVTGKKNGCPRQKGAK